MTDPPPASPVIAAAGDIACDSEHGDGHDLPRRSSRRISLVNQGLAAVLPLGDIQYENGELANFNAYYDPTWGRVKDITYPASRETTSTTRPARPATTATSAAGRRRPATTATTSAAGT